ncbi:MAG: DUF1444 family protein [Pseudomonadota bacterium]
MALRRACARRVVALFFAIGLFAAALPATAQQAAPKRLGPDDSSAIVAIIKPVNWVYAALDSTKSKGQPSIVMEPLTSELWIVYGLDTGAAIHFLNLDQLGELNLKQEDLRQLATENLARIINNGFSINQIDAFYTVSAGGMYETSLLLFDAFWEKPPFEIEGETLVAVPRRGVLIIGSSAKPERVKELRLVAESNHANGEHPISPNVFVRRDGGFAPYTD